LIYRTLF